MTSTPLSHPAVAETAAPTPAVCRSRARMLLGKKDVRISCSLALLAVLTAFIAGTVTIETAASFILGGENAFSVWRSSVAYLLIDAASFTVGLLFACPLSAGYRRMTADLVLKGSCDMRLLFSSFSSFRLFFSSFAGSLMSLMPLIAAALIYFLSSYIALTDGSFAAALFAVSASLIAVPSVMILARQSYRSYVTAFGEADSMKPDLSKKPALMRLLSKIIFRSVAGWFFSLITLGILYFIHYGPLFAAERAAAVRLTLYPAPANGGKSVYNGDDFIYD